MSSPETETKVYFGESLDEVLPKIREELGPDALIVRQREGIVGGIGGFFGRKCVEVEARPSIVRSVLPPRAVINAYDTGDPFSAFAPDPELGLRADGDDYGALDSDAFQHDRQRHRDERQLDDHELAEQRLDEQRLDEQRFEGQHFDEERFEELDTFDEPTLDVPPASNRLLETLLAQTSPFAERLSTVLADDVDMAPPAPSMPTEPRAEPKPDPRARPTRQRAAARPPVAHADTSPFAAPISLDELAAIKRELLAAAIPIRMAGEILAEVELSLHPFEPEAPLRDLARRALGRRIPIASGWKTKRRTIALVGLPGSGRTLAAAGLCSAYVRDGRSVAAVSLEQARAAFRLAELTSLDEIPFQIADAPDLAARVRGLVRNAEVVIADTPPLTDPIDGDRLAATLALLKALSPDETHLVLPATMRADDGRTLLEVLAAHKLPTRLIVSNADASLASGVPVGLALTHRIPLSFIGAGPTVGALRPATGERLARMVIQ